MLTSAIIHPCLVSHISLRCVCVLILHCTHTTEDAAFGILIRTHVLQSCTPQQGDMRRQNKQIYRINAVKKHK